MKLSYKLYATILLFTIAGCKTQNELTYRTASSHVREVNDNGMVQTPLIVDINVSDKMVTGTFSSENVSVEYAKNMAVVDALKKSNADVLVEPKFYVEVTGKLTKAEATGYPANYKNFRKPALPAAQGNTNNLDIVKPGTIIQRPTDKSTKK